LSFKTWKSVFTNVRFRSWLSKPLSVNAALLMNLIAAYIDPTPKILSWINKDFISLPIYHDRQSCSCTDISGDHICPGHLPVVTKSNCNIPITWTVCGLLIYDKIISILILSQTNYFVFAKYYWEKFYCKKSETILLSHDVNDHVHFKSVLV